MADVLEFMKGSDICKCGDFRSQHANGKRCACGDCTCPKFDFYSVGTPADQAAWRRRFGAGEPKSERRDEFERKQCETFLDAQAEMDAEEHG